MRIEKLLRKILLCKTNFKLFMKKNKDNYNKTIFQKLQHITFHKQRLKNQMVFQFYERGILKKLINQN